MSRQILITEESPASRSTTPRVRDPIDLEDVLVVLGMMFAETAAIIIWWPAALILASVFCFGAVYLRTRVPVKR